MSTKHDFTNQVFGRLTAICPTDLRWRKQIVWHCKCLCGEEVDVPSHQLANGKVKSCGCYRREMGIRRGKASTKHGHSGHRRGKVHAGAPEYASWSHAISRCHNPKHTAYRWYGAKGITVCDRWRTSYEAFLEDMGRRPSDKHSLDRIDNSKGYSPENCRWATIKEQARNTSQNRLITVDGVTKTMTEWCEIVGIRVETFYQRLRRGLSEQAAVMLPKQIGGRKTKPFSEMKNPKPKLVWKPCQSENELACSPLNCPLAKIRH